MKKRALTLLEIMIVIFLITLITGTIGYNMRGALDKGRAFRSEQAKEQLHDLLLMRLAEGGNPDEIANNPEAELRKLGIAKDPKNLILDGWKEKFEVHLNKNKTDFTVHSDKLDRYLAKQRRANSGSAAGNDTQPNSEDEE